MLNLNPGLVQFDQVWLGPIDRIGNLLLRYHPYQTILCLVFWTSRINPVFFLTKNRILGFPSPPRHRFGTEGTLSEAPEERPTFSELVDAILGQSG